MRFKAALPARNLNKPTVQTMTISTHAVVSPVALVLLRHIIDKPITLEGAKALCRMRWRRRSITGYPMERRAFRRHWRARIMWAGMKRLIVEVQP